MRAPQWKAGVLGVRTSDERVYWQETWPVARVGERATTGESER